VRTLETLPLASSNTSRSSSPTQRIARAVPPLFESRWEAKAMRRRRSRALVWMGGEGASGIAESVSRVYEEEEAKRAVGGERRRKRRKVTEGKVDEPGFFHIVSVLTHRNTARMV
jgi:hypothetical protein